LARSSDAAIDSPPARLLLPGGLHPNRESSGDFIALLQKLDRAYPEHHQIRSVLDNHSAHISKETRGYLQTMPQRFVFVFTPKHGSWLNLIENQFSKMTRTMLRGIRVASKQELIDRNSSIFRGNQCGPGGVSLEIQNGRDYYCIDNKRTVI
jgi:transposase